MAETFLFNIANKVLEEVTSFAVQEIRLARGLAKELDNLKETLTTIKAVLLDAEERQAQSHELKVWLQRLKVVCHHADDILDEIHIVVLWQQSRPQSIKEKVKTFLSDSNPVLFRFRMAHEIKNIRDRLDKIAADKNRFHLVERMVDRTVVPRDRDTYSFLQASDVVGRDEDRDYIVNLLTNMGESDGFHVIPIVGMGGLGKTTLAKMVFNDERITNQFDIKMWVCVSEEFDLKFLLRKIIESATGTESDAFEIELLQARVRGILKGMRYLLVLDDVWNENLAKWVQLRDILSSAGANGSKVIVSTRSQIVASIMGTVSSYELQGLAHEDSVSLFVKWAFNDGEEMHYENLMAIGEDIVRKCKGVPLAIRTLASFLYMKGEERDWIFVRDRHMCRIDQEEGDILPVLRLSYDQLPSHLKQCFAHCSIFPKDYDFYSYELICQWMAHGLIHDSDSAQNLEEIGERYIRDLISRSFFQDVVDYGCFMTFKIHDLLHDLALSVVGNEYVTIDNCVPEIPYKPTVRHLATNSHQFVTARIRSELLQLKNLRTIFFPQFEQPIGPFLDTCISRFKRLRMLNLRDSSFEVLPASICCLKHLRYLDLSENIHIRSLPNSLCELQCLQTLRLFGCTELEKLPKNFGRLTNLRFLTLTTRERCISITSLGVCLRTLHIYHCDNLERIVCYDDINGIQSPIVLRTLSIQECNKLVSLPVGLSHLTKLENLVLTKMKKLDLMKGESQGRGVGLRSLQYLGLVNLPKLMTLPEWLLQGAVASLVYLKIFKCSNFTMLPSSLVSLRKLEIGNCPKLISLPEGMQRLTMLKYVGILDCPNLIRRCQRETGDEWHKIAHVPKIYFDRVRI